MQNHENTLTFKQKNDKFWQVWTNMDNIRPIWTICDQFGQCRANMDNLSLIKANMYD